MIGITWLRRQTNGMGQINLGRQIDCVGSSGYLVMTGLRNVLRFQKLQERGM